MRLKKIKLTESLYKQVDKIFEMHFHLIVTIDEALDQEGALNEWENNLCSGYLICNDNDENGIIEEALAAGLDYAQYLTNQKELTYFIVEREDLGHHLVVFNHDPELWITKMESYFRGFVTRYKNDILLDETTADYKQEAKQILRDTLIAKYGPRQESLENQNTCDGKIVEVDGKKYKLIEV